MRKTVLKQLIGILALFFFISGCELPNGLLDGLKVENEVVESLPQPLPTSSPNPNLRVSLFFESVGSAGSNGNLVVDNHGNIFYPDSNGRVIQKVDINGVQTIFAGSGANAYIDGIGTNASFYVPYLLAIDNYDNLYLADGFKIRKITPGAVVTTIASIVTGPPSGIAADNSGNTYVTKGDVILKITSQGSVSTFAGSTPGYVDGMGSSAKFKNPKDLVIDSFGNIFVADTGNYLIRKVSPSRAVTTFAGSGVREIQDGVGTEAGFYFYESYAHMGIDKSNNIYIGDMTGIGTYEASVIRKVSPDGNVTTYCGVTEWVGFTGSCSEVRIISRFGVGIGPDRTVYFVDGNSLFRISSSN